MSCYLLLVATLYTGVDLLAGSGHSTSYIYTFDTLLQQQQVAAIRAGRLSTLIYFTALCISRLRVFARVRRECLIGRVAACGVWEQ